MRVLGFLLARDSPGIMRERERGKGEKSSYGKRGREREREGVEIGRREARNERGLRHRETEFGVLFITSELTSTTMPSLRTVHRYFSLSLSLSIFLCLIRMHTLPNESSSSYFFEKFSPDTESTTDREPLSSR